MLPRKIVRQTATHLSQISKTRRLGVVFYRKRSELRAFDVGQAVPSAAPCARSVWPDRHGHCLYHHPANHGRDGHDNGALASALL